MKTKFLLSHLLYIFALLFPLIAIPILFVIIFFVYYGYKKVRHISKPFRIEIRKFAKYSLVVVMLLIPLTTAYFYKHYLRHKWYAEERVSLMFTALKNGDYNTALKHFDPKRKINDITLFKKILNNGEILKVSNFEILYTQVNNFDDWDNPPILVYVKINFQSKPVVLYVQYNKLMGYAAHSLLE